MGLGAKHISQICNIHAPPVYALAGASTQSTVFRPCLLLFRPPGQLDLVDALTSSLLTDLHYTKLHHKLCVENDELCIKKIQ